MAAKTSKKQAKRTATKKPAKPAVKPPTKTRSAMSIEQVAREFQELAARIGVNVNANQEEQVVSSHHIKITRVRALDSDSFFFRGIKMRRTRDTLLDFLERFARQPERRATLSLQFFKKTRFRKKRALSIATAL